MCMSIYRRLTDSKRKERVRKLKTGAFHHHPLTPPVLSGKGVSLCARARGKERENELSQDTQRGTANNQSNRGRLVASCLV